MSTLTGLQCSPDPPGFICVHNSVSFCLFLSLPVSLPLPLSFFCAALCLSHKHPHGATTTQHIQIHVTITLSCCFGTEMVHPRPSHMPVNYSIQKSERRASCSTKLAPKQRDRRRTEERHHSTCNFELS